MSDSQQIRDYSQLCHTIRRKDVETVRRLLQTPNINVNTLDQNRNTPLHLAIINFNDSDIITMLLDKGANIHAINNSNKTPFWIAINSNKTEAAALLIKKGAVVAENLYSVLLKAMCKNNFIIVELINSWIRSNPSIDLRTPLNTAISKGDVKIIKLILPHCQFIEPSDKYIPKETVTNSNRRHKDCVELLLKWNFTIRPDSHQDKDFIYAAVEKGYLPIVLQLLELGIDVNMVDSNTGLNLLTVACLNEHHEIVEILLKHGANVNVKIPAKDWKSIKPWYFYSNLKSYNKFFSPDHQNQLSDITCLHIAALNSDSKTMRVLLKYNPTIDHEMAFNLTCIAAHHGCDDIVRIFLDRGVDVTNTDPQGRSLLHYCISLKSDSGDQYSRYNIAKLVLEKAANINIQKPDALLRKAIRNKFDAKFIALLLNHKCPVNAKNVYGWTPLHFACKIESDHQLENIKVLLERGANPNTTNRENQTALHMVCESRFIRTFDYNNTYEQQQDTIERIIKLLLQHNAIIGAVDSRNLTPLKTAYLYRNKAAVNCLLENHAKNDYIFSENSALFSFAIQERCDRMIKNLIKNGADINDLDEENRTPLQYAIQILYVNSSLCQEMVKLLKTQVVKLKVAGLYVINKNLDQVYNSNSNDFTIDIQQLEAKCQQEIERMKIKCIGNDKITLDILLKKNITILSRLDEIEEIQKALKLGVYDEEFPLYIDIIRSKVREAKIRYHAMNSAREYFHVNVCHYLPCECIDLVLSYLKIKELKMFIEAMKPLNY